MARVADTYGAWNRVHKMVWATSRINGFREIPFDASIEVLSLSSSAYKLRRFSNTFLETMNPACFESLPVLFVCT